MYVTQQPLLEARGDEPDKEDEVASVTEDAQDWIVGTEDAEDEEEFLFGPMSDDEDHAMAAKQEPIMSDPIVTSPEGDQREPRDLHAPVRPSARAVELHNYTHLPYRSWCSVCRAAKCKEDAHPRRKPGTEEELIDGNALPIISLDYQELNEEAEHPQKVIVGKDEKTKSVFCHRIIAKGLTDEWAIKKIIQDIRDLGRNQIILKTDGEPAIMAVQARIVALRESQTVPRNPPAYNPQSNGPCEKAVQDVTTQLRTMKLALENRVKVKILDELPIMQWALEHASFLINRFSVGKDGMTPYERTTGRRWRRPLLEFGESVMAKLSLQRRNKGHVRKLKRKLAPRAIPAVWVGQVGRTGEHIVIKRNGDAVRCRTVKRSPAEERWDPEAIMLVKATPRYPAPSAKDPEKLKARLVDDEQAEKASEEASKDDQEARAAAEPLTSILKPPEVREETRRNFRITGQLMEKYGRTPGCAGCEHIATGPGDHRGHTDECRGRFREAMLADEDQRERVLRADERLGEATAPQIDAQDDDVVMRAVRFDEEDDEIPELSAESEEDDDTPKQDVDMIDGDSDAEEDAASAAKRQRISSFIRNLPDLHTCVAQTMALHALNTSSHGSGETWDSPLTRCQPKPAGNPNEMINKGEKVDNIDVVERQMLSMLNQLNQIKTNRDVKKIIERLGKTKKLKAPKMKPMQRPSMHHSGDADVAELYSLPRVTEMAGTMGMKPGFALDLMKDDEDDGEPWDFSRAEKRKKAAEKVDREKPFMLITSPMCAKFCQLQALFNYPRMDPKKVSEAIMEAMTHLKFCLELCLRQHRAGRLFIFEHPAFATSWSYEFIVEFAKLDGVHRVQFDFCRMGMATKDENGDMKLAKKPTAILTNSDAVATLLRHAQCLGDHDHVHLVNGRASPCQRYPDKFTKAICEGVRREMDTIRWRNELYEVLDVTTPFGKLMNLQEIVEKSAVAPEESPLDKLYDGQEFMDDIHGGVLDKKLATAARQLEIDFFRKMGVYTKVKREPWMKVISTKWIDTNKGDIDEPNYRARLVGREIATHKRDDLFAATPPLESLRYIVSRCASNQYHADATKKFSIMSNDIKRAYFYAPSTRPVYILIPDEDREAEDEGRVGQLNLSLYGTRDAAMNWTKTFTDHLTGIGFERGTACPCNFYHPSRDVSLTVHGDDYTSTGRIAELKWLDGQLKAKFDTKTLTMGPEDNQLKQLRVLNRIISWTPDGIEFEPDQRHAELIVAGMGVTAGVNTPGSREEATKASKPETDGDENGEGVDLTALNELAAKILPEEESETPMLEPSEATTFRGLAARANYLALDRPDIQFSVKEIARRMARPRQEDWQLLKRLARYLVNAPRAVAMFAWQHQPTAVDVFVDADWAGCKKTSRSTSGGAIMVGWHPIKTWSSTQATVALSSGESELYALTKGASQALGFMGLARDLGDVLDARVHTDASATLGMVNRQGLGKLRHVKVQYLWLQERVRRKDLSVDKVLGTENPADLMTKYLPASDMEKHLTYLSVERRTSRADAAPKLGISQLRLQDRWRKEAGPGDPSNLIREHVKPRSSLFTPMRLDGSPPAKSLTKTRRTVGNFLDNGEEFVIVDEWTGKLEPHRDLKRLWTGTTAFTFRVNDMGVGNKVMRDATGCEASRIPRISR